MRKKILSSVLCCVLIFTSMFSLSAVNASAASKKITSFQQADYNYSAERGGWGNYPYGFKDEAEKEPGTIATSGCGLLSYVNAVHYLNGRFIDPRDLANWALKNNCRPSGGGTDPKFFKEYTNAEGYKYNIKYVGETGSYSELKEHLKSGGVAIGSVPNHYVAVVDYNSSTGKYLILDSAAKTYRKTYPNGYTWQTEKACENNIAKLNFKKFRLLASTAPVPSDIRIADGNYNPVTLDEGKSYSINGLISSNKKLTSVTVGVYNINGSPTNYVKTVNLNATTYNIKNLDSYIKFGKLPVAPYQFRVVATDVTGYTKTLVNNTFAVNKPTPSNINIGSGNYNPGTLQRGKSYSINGLITSAKKLTSVTVGVYTANGTATSYVKTVNPNAVTYNIDKLDSYIKFGQLSTGTYIFQVIAKDSAGYSKNLVSNIFTVVPKAEIKIGNGKYNPGTLKAGQSYSINGLISSTNKLTSVTVGIYNINGSPTSYVKTVNPNATTYNIKNLDSYIKFGKLTAGPYQFRVVAKDATGYTKTLVNNTFTVKPVSKITIGSGKYNPGTLKKGKSYSINGIISSNYNLTSVTVGVYKSNGTATSYVKTVNPNAKAYNIKNLDSYIKFGKLSVDTYKFKVVAKDSTGYTTTLVNNTFKVK